MNTSFYTAALGAGSQQAKLNVLSNNLANLNTNGYRARSPVFADLLYTNMGAAQNGNLQKGHSMRLDKTDLDFKNPGNLYQSGRDMDFYIDGEGYFALMNPATEEVVYTRDGGFQISNFEDGFFLTDYLGRQVLNAEGEPVEVTVTSNEGEIEVDEEESQDLLQKIGIYHVPIQNGIVAVGNNAFTVTDKNGEVYAQTEEGDEEGPKSSLIRGVVELSNVDMATEFGKVIEAQRGYQYSLKMVQTSDEIEQTVNELRR